MIHVLSHRRLSTLLKFGGIGATTFHKNGTTLACSAKFNLITGGRKNIVGCVVDEDELAMKIRIDDKEEMLEMKRPRHNDGRHTHEHQGSDSRSLTEIWPVRIKMNSAGIFSFILSSTTLNEIA